MRRTNIKTIHAQKSRFCILVTQYQACRGVFYHGVCTGSRLHVKNDEPAFQA